MGFTLVDVYLNWLNWFHFLILKGGLLVILIDCIILLLPFLDVTRRPMLTVSFLVQLDSRTLAVFNCRFFLNRFLVCFSLFLLLLLVTPYFVVAVQPCMEWILISKKLRIFVILPLNSKYLFDPLTYVLT